MVVVLTAKQRRELAQRVARAADRYVRQSTKAPLGDPCRSM